MIGHHPRRHLETHPHLSRSPHRPAARSPALILTVSALRLVIGAPLSESLWVLYVFASLSGLAYMGALTTLATLVGETFGMANIGKVLGALNMSFVLAAFVGPLLGGVAYDTQGTYRPAFIGVVVAAGIAAVLILRIKAVPVGETETV